MHKKCADCESTSCVWKSIGDVMIDPVMIGLEDDIKHMSQSNSGIDFTLVF